MTDQPDNIFNLKRNERDCPHCADGRLHVERINDYKANHYCDTCDHFTIYSIDPPPMNVIPHPPLPESTMPKGQPTGLNKTEYQRYYACGKPDMEAFKAAGCPTKREWDKLQAGTAEPGEAEATKTPTPAAPKPDPKPKPPAPREAVGVQDHASAELPAQELELQAEGSVKVKLVAIQCEGDPDQVLGSIGELIRKLL